MNAKCKRGFTLVETAVCIGITVVLSGIALPVINDAREEARQIACANRLTEITLGSLQYQEANDQMPPITTSDGLVEQSDINLSNDQNTGALAYILPFIGEQELFDLMPEIATQPDLFLNSSQSLASFSDFANDPGMFAALSTQTESFICPSNADLLNRPLGRLFHTAVQAIDVPGTIFLPSIPIGNSPESFGRTSYLPSIGGHPVQFESFLRALDLSVEDVAGAMRNRTTSIRSDELGDGASNTICWSESLGHDLKQDFIFDGEVGASFALLSSTLATGNSYIADLDNLDTILFGDGENSFSFLIGSNHINGNNVAFCDGSVRFLSNRTSRDTMMALGCGNDGFFAERKQ